MFGGAENIQYSKLTAGADTSKLSVLDLVSQDLNAYLDQGNDRQKRLNFLSRKLEIHKKTLQRISVKENKPSYPTIIKLYRFLYNVDSDHKVLEMVPEVIREFLKKSFPDEAMEQRQYSESNIRILAENPVALEIYLLAAVKSVSSSEIKSKFGANGLKTIADLVVEKLLSESKPSEFSIGSRKVIFTPEMIILAGRVVLAAYAKPESGYEVGKNYSGFYGEKLNEQAYKEWLAIDETAMQEKIKIAQKKESAGEIPAFCFSIIDTFNSNEGDL